MNGVLVTAMLVLSLAVIVVRRRTVAIVLLAAQSTRARPHRARVSRTGSAGDLLVAAFLLRGKAVLLPRCCTC